MNVSKAEVDAKIQQMMIEGKPQKVINEYIESVGGRAFVSDLQVPVVSNDITINVGENNTDETINSETEDSKMSKWVKKLGVGAVVTFGGYAAWKNREAIITFFKDGKVWDTIKGIGKFIKDTAKSLYKFIKDNAWPVVKKVCEVVGHFVWITCKVKNVVGWIKGLFKKKTTNESVCLAAA